jgi:serine/threonine protein kinase
MTEQSIFLSALEMPAAQRAGYLDSACAGDRGLRRQVQALLAAHERGGSFLDDPAVEQIAAARPTPEPDATEIEAEGGGPRVGPPSFLRPGTRPGSLGRLGHYEVLEVLGEGGFGTVLRAFDDRLHRVVAIKVLAPHLATSGTARARFIREARSGAAVRDELVVGIHEVSNEDEPVPYLVMEYVAGQTLQQKLDRTGPLSVHEVLRIGHQVASGLAAAHATGLIHRDVKPANILLENGVERVKLTDFGLARAADDASISQSGLVAGTPMYMAPEQAHGRPIDHRADLFSLGSVLYAMCTGRPPFRANSAMAVLKRVCEDDPRPVREINPEVPPWLSDVVARLHAKDPAERFQSATEVADLLAKYLTELQVHGVVTTPATSPPTRPRSRWKWPAIAATFLVAASVLTCVSVGPPVIDYVRGVGRLVVRIDDPGVIVVVVEHGTVQGVGDHPIRLREGKYSIRAEKEVAGERLTKEWEEGVERGGNKVVVVKAAELKPEPGSRRVQPPPPPIPDKQTKDSLGDAILLMSFDKDDFYPKDGQTWVRDRSGHGNDGECAKVDFTPDGKAGGGLASGMGGEVRLSKSLVNRLPGYTIVAWVRPAPPKAARQRLYQMTDPANPIAPLFALHLRSRNDDRLGMGIHVEAFNDNLKPTPWTYAQSGGNNLRVDNWHFVSVVLDQGRVGEGRLQISIDNMATGTTSQMVDAPGPGLVDVVAQNLEGVLDEVAVFPRALPPGDTEFLRQLGLAGKSLSAARPASPPAKK